jgi:murein DD-endopeptidase MepM/ murein hydrolase activator NlpD
VARVILVLACVAAAATAAARPSPAASPCVAASDRALAYQQQRGHKAKELAKLQRAALACTSGRQRFAFWPQGGRLDGDLYLTNTVDLDDDGALRDPWCGTRTYDGHTGEDVVIRSFREQAAGVPVFAALDGKVTKVQEGAKDTNYGSQTLPWDNHVQIDSGHGQMAIYGHLRRGSVKVKIGDWVVAGQQLGLTGSSGNSSWPHLHLTLFVDSQPVDLWSGPCNPTSYWVDQPPVRTDPFARDFTLSAQPFSDRAGLPWDEGPRTGSFALGVRDLWFRSMLLNANAVSTQRIRILRPDGSVAQDTTGAPDWSRWRQTDAVWHARLNLDATGTWRIEVLLDGAKLLDQPFEVTAPGTAVVNRPPAGATPQLAQAANGAWTCQLDFDLLHGDPDYDLVRFRYVWRVGTKIVRSLTAGGLQDVLPRTFAGARPTCTVTTLDGASSGPTITA